MNKLSFDMPAVRSENGIEAVELMTTAQLAEHLHTTKDVILANAKKCLSKLIEHGKPTFWNQAEITLLLDYMKSHTSNNRSVELNSTLANTSTDLTPALKIKKAMELMQEGYEEELAILRAKNLEQAQRLAIVEPKAKWYDNFADCTGLIEIGAVGKHLEKYGLGAQKIFTRLKDDGIIYEKTVDGVKSYFAYFRYRQYFVYRSCKYEKPDGKKIAYSKLMCTKAGAQWLESKYSVQA